MPRTPYLSSSTFLNGLLNAILPDVLDAHRPGGSEGFDRVPFGHCNDPYRL